MERAGERLELISAASLWTLCSLGLYSGNRLAIGVFPMPCGLLMLQFVCGMIGMAACWPVLHFGSRWEVLRWAAVVGPFILGSFLTGIFAAHYASVSAIIVLRSLSPALALAVELLCPSPIQVSGWMLLALGAIFTGAALYVSEFSIGVFDGSGRFAGLGWAVASCTFAVGDRVAQRLLLGKDQFPVEISKAGVTLLNNALSVLPVLGAALVAGEERASVPAFFSLSAGGLAVVALACIGATATSFTGVWVQSLVSATGYLVLTNAVWCVTCLVEAGMLGLAAASAAADSAHASGLAAEGLRNVQVVGLFLTIVGGAAYGAAAERLTSTKEKLPWTESEVSERTPFLAPTV